MKDVLIVGAGVAGLTASIYLQRAGLSATVLDRGTYGGQIAVTGDIENFPAFLRITGPELAENIYRQAQAQGAQIQYGEVLAAQLEGIEKKVVTGDGEICARAVILANGAKRRKLGVPGEEKFTGKGVSYCATCDGMFFRGKTVAICGGGNTALEDALYLSNVCERVLLIHRRDTFTAEKTLIKAVGERKNIETFLWKQITEIQGNHKVEAVLIADVKDGKSESLTAEGCFVAIGYEPDNQLYAGQITLDNRGYILAGEDCCTNLAGVYAAGDCRSKELRQIITAAADGAVAAWHASRYLNLQP